MTTRAGHSGNGVAPRFEPWAEYAAVEIEAAPLAIPGVCYRPGCGRAFVMGRDWQIYCCRECAAMEKAEFRLWGHRFAWPLLVHRLGKYDRRDPAVMNRTKAARRFVTQLQSKWAADRQKRAAQSSERQGSRT